MARYYGDNPPPPGRYGNGCVYVFKGITCFRVPNPLSGERVKTAAAFANTRKYAALLAIASPLAAVAYRTLPVNRKRTHYQKLVGKAIQWLKEGKSTATIELLLQEAAEQMARELSK